MNMTQGPRFTRNDRVVHLDDVASGEPVQGSVIRVNTPMMGGWFTYQVDWDDNMEDAPDYPERDLMFVGDIS